MRLAPALAPALALLLSSCLVDKFPPLIKITQSDAETILDRWVLSGQPAGYCRRRTNELHVLIVPEPDMPQWCFRSDVAGCYRSVLCDEQSCHTIIVMKGTRVSRELLRHELTHWLLDCSGVVPGGDYYHVHQLWLQGGFPGATLVSDPVELRADNAGGPSYE